MNICIYQKKIVPLQTRMRDTLIRIGVNLFRTHVNNIRFLRY